MKKNKIQLLLMLAIGLSIAACDTDVKHKTPVVGAPVLEESDPAANATNVKAGNKDITLTYDKNVFFATEDISLLTLTGDGEILDANVYGSSEDFTIHTRLKKETSYTLTVPQGVVLGPTQVEAPEVSVSFSTIALNKSLVNPNATAATQKVFSYLLENYENKILSGTMAEVNWNTNEAEMVYQWTGKYPAMNCFDYVHIYVSPANWIDYDDITPVKDWWDAGGLVSMMWHWNVPVEDPAVDPDAGYNFYIEDNAFDAAHINDPDAWEYDVFWTDIAKVAESLKTLQQEGIVVIWRPFHEAAGGWFWWGRDADSFKTLWTTMFDYFQSEGLNNLIWVWTCQTEDEDWYPGDNYVDIIGCDIYNADASASVAEYDEVDEEYGHKMIALTECGSVGLISEQWAAGGRWSWFMPWYNAEEDTTAGEHEHADEEWWQDAMSQDFVITRDQLPDLK